MYATVLPDFEKCAVVEYTYVYQVNILSMHAVKKHFSLHALWWLA